MKKFIPYLVSALIIIFGTIPAINFEIPILNDWWPWMVVLSGFFGLLTMFIKTSPIVKIVAVCGFANCFLAYAPFISFVSYFSLIAACYFFILCSRIENWTPVFLSLQTLLFLNIWMIVFQFFGNDPVLNFSLKNPAYIGIVGQSMQTASMIVILCAFLLSYSRANVLIPLLISIPCTSAWAILCSFAGWIALASKKHRKTAMYFAPVAMIIFLIFGGCTHKFARNMDKFGRIGVWARSIELSTERPLTGYGLGSFKFLFPIKSNIPTLPWKTAHNSFVQLYFECGILAVLLFGGYIFHLLTKLYSLNLLRCFSGLIMIVLDSLVHFPERMIQAVLILVAFFAFCEFKIRERSHAS